MKEELQMWEKHIDTDGLVGIEKNTHQKIEFWMHRRILKVMRWKSKT